MKASKTRAIASAAAAFALVASACGSDDAADEPAAEPPAETEAAIDEPAAEPAAEPMKVGIVAPSAENDPAWSQSICTEYQVDGEDPILEVEGIEDHMGKGARLKYLVKWKGHEVKTYEPWQHLHKYGAKEVIEQYRMKNVNDLILTKN